MNLNKENFNRDYGDYLLMLHQKGLRILETEELIKELKNKYKKQGFDLDVHELDMQEIIISMERELDNERNELKQWTDELATDLSPQSALNRLLKDN